MNDQIFNDASSSNDGNKAEELIRAAGEEPGSENLDRVRAALQKFADRKGGETTASGSEAVSDAPKGFTGSGKDVDWSEYDLDYSVKHLYPNAHYRETPQGPKWLVQVDEFISTEKEYRNYGKRVNGTNGEHEYLNLGQYLNDMLNGPEEWKLVSLLPGTTGRVGLLLQRKVVVVLPDPIPFNSEFEVEAPSDPELERLEKTTLDFIGKEDLTSNSKMSDTVSEEPKHPSFLEQMAVELNGPPLRDPGPLGASVAEYEQAPLAAAVGKEVAEVDLNTLKDLDTPTEG